MCLFIILNISQCQLNAKVTKAEQEDKCQYGSRISSYTVNDASFFQKFGISSFNATVPSGKLSKCTMKDTLITCNTTDMTDNWYLSTKLNSSVSVTFILPNGTTHKPNVPYENITNDINWCAQSKDLKVSVIQVGNYENLKDSEYTRSEADKKYPGVKMKQFTYKILAKAVQKDIPTDAQIGQIVSLKFKNDAEKYKFFSVCKPKQTISNGTEGIFECETSATPINKTTNTTELESVDYKQGDVYSVDTNSANLLNKDGVTASAFSQKITVGGANIIVTKVAQQDKCQYGSRISSYLVPDTSFFKDLKISSYESTDSSGKLSKCTINGTNITCNTTKMTENWYFSTDKAYTESKTITAPNGTKYNVKILYQNVSNDVNWCAQSNDVKLSVLKVGNFSNFKESGKTTSGGVKMKQFNYRILVKPVQKDLPGSAEVGQILNLKFDDDEDDKKYKFFSVCKPTKGQSILNGIEGTLDCETSATAVENSTELDYVDYNQSDIYTVDTNSDDLLNEEEVSEKSFSKEITSKTDDEEGAVRPAISKSSGLSGGAIAGIAVACGAVLLGTLLGCLLCKRGKQATPVNTNTIQSVYTQEIKPVYY